MFNFMPSVLVLFISLIGAFCFKIAHSIESIFTTPDVFITSKIKPTKDYESDRGNLLHDSHELEKSRKYSIGQMLKDLPGMASQGMGNASRPVIRGLGNSRVKILQNSSSLADVSEFGAVSYTHLTLPTR